MIAFSAAQQKAIAAAVTLLAALLILAATLGLLWLLAQLAAFFAGVLAPVAAAFVLALVIRPYYEWLRRAGRLPPLPAVLAVIASIMAPLAGFAWFFGFLLVNQAAELLARLPDWLENLRLAIADHQPQVAAFIQDHQLDARLRTFLRERGDFIFSGALAIGRTAWSAGAGAFAKLIGLAGWLVLPVYFGCFLMMQPPTADRARAWLPFLKPDTRSDAIFLAREFTGIVTAFFRGQFLVALLQGALYAAGFLAAGLSYGFALGLLLGFLNLIPYLGTMAGLAMALPLAYFQADGGWFRLLLTAAVIAAVQMVEGYVLTPRIMAGRTGLHPVAIIFAVFFWGTALGGIFGMVLAIPLTACFVTFWRLAQAKYIKGII